MYDLERTERWMWNLERIGKTERTEGWIGKTERTEGWIAKTERTEGWIGHTQGTHYCKQHRASLTLPAVRVQQPARQSKRSIVWGRLRGRWVSHAARESEICLGSCRLDPPGVVTLPGSGQSLLTGSCSDSCLARGWTLPDNRTKAEPAEVLYRSPVTDTARDRGGEEGWKERGGEIEAETERRGERRTTETSRER